VKAQRNKEMKIQLRRFALRQGNDNRPTEFRSQQMPRYFNSLKRESIGAFDGSPVTLDYFFTIEKDKIASLAEKNRWRT
jgi:hypothetical protein